MQSTRNSLGKGFGQESAWGISQGIVGNSSRNSRNSFWELGELSAGIGKIFCGNWGHFPWEFWELSLGIREIFFGKREIILADSMNS